MWQIHLPTDTQGPGSQPHFTGQQGSSREVAWFNKFISKLDTNMSQNSGQIYLKILYKYFSKCDVYSKGSTREVAWFNKFILKLETNRSQNSRQIYTKILYKYLSIYDAYSKNSTQEVAWFKLSLTAMPNWWLTTHHVQSCEMSWMWRTYPCKNICQLG